MGEYVRLTIGPVLFLTSAGSGRLLQMTRLDQIQLLGQNELEVLRDRLHGNMARSGRDSKLARAMRRHIPLRTGHSGQS